MAEGTNKASKLRPVGSLVSPMKYDTEGTDAHGREISVIREEIPTRIDEVSENLIYLGWAEYGADENASVWKIRRIQKVGTVWQQKYANGEQFYRHKWSERSLLVFL